MLLHGSRDVAVKDGKIVLLEGFCSGPVKRLHEEGCLYVVPERESKIIALSEEDMEYVEIKEGEEVSVAGCNYWYEIWNQEKFKEFLEEMEGGRYESIAESLEIEF